MPDLDDDMGELFLKASTDIRLKPANDEWDLIKSRLSKESSFSQVPESKTIDGHLQRILLIASIVTGITILNPLITRDSKSTKMQILRKTESAIQKTEKDSHFASPVTSMLKNNGSLRRLKEIREISVFPIHENLMNQDLPISEELSKYSSLTINIASFEKTSLLEKTKSDSQSFKSGNAFEKQIEKNKDPSAEKRFYAGILAGPQFSQTKAQSFSNAGLSAGILLGFHLSKRLAFETGFLITNKQYSSAGQYFDISKISASMPPGMHIIQVSSKTQVLEIPVNLKYDLLKNIKSNFFISGGFSSYILTSEKNLYQASLNGNNETMTGNYPTHHSYFAASVNISVGYEDKVSKTVNLRIEPYFHIPVKPTGMGSMHVQSAGINLGFTIPVIK